MRTKTLVFSAALLAVGIAALNAQSVYSINAVGYVNVTVLPGFNLICNPLNGTNNALNTIAPVAPNGSLALKWSNSGQGFVSTDTYFVVGNPTDDGWYNSNFEKTTNVFNPGEGFFFKNISGGSSTLTFVGEVPQGNLTNRIGSNNGFYSSIVPQSAGLTSMGFPPVNGMKYTSWNPATQGYVNTLTYFVIGNPTDDGWYNANFDKVEPTPAVGEGFLVFNPGAPVDWTRSFTVNN